MSLIETRNIIVGDLGAELSMRFTVDWQPKLDNSVKECGSVISEKKRECRDLDLATITDDSVQELRGLVISGKVGQIMDMLPRGEFDLATINSNGEWLLKTLMVVGKVGEVISKLPEKIDLASIGEAGALLMEDCIVTSGVNEDVWSLFPDKIDLADVGNGGIYLLQTLIGKGQKKELGKRVQTRDFRKPIFINPKNVSVEELPLKVDSVIKRAIDDFPINLNHIYKRNGWLVSDLNKDGSLTKILIKNLDTPSDLIVLFFHHGINVAPLITYRKATELLPDYVSSSTYPELSENDGQKKYSFDFSSDGFREVFAGPSLDKLNLEDLPLEIKRSIVGQKNHILLTLAENRIKHGHTHDGNFNVRFLLEGKDGERKLCFDPYRALKMAIDGELAITPIVILRDWDRAKI